MTFVRLNAPQNEEGCEIIPLNSFLLFADKRRNKLRFP
jgi:hypothetical protein